MNNMNLFAFHRTKLTEKWVNLLTTGNSPEHLLQPDDARFFVDEVLNFLASEVEQPSATDVQPLQHAANRLRNIPLSQLFSFIRSGKSHCFSLLNAKPDITQYEQINNAFDQLTGVLLNIFEKENETSAALNCRITPALFSWLSLLSSAFKNSTDGIIITDAKGIILDANRAFLAMFGYEYDEVVGKRTGFLRSPKTSDTFYQQMWQSINTNGEWKGEIINRAKNGVEIPVWLSITPINRNGQRIGYLGIEIDMREKKQMERELLKAERLAMIGQMAAKVAHEIRNPLSSMSLNAELLGDELEVFGLIASTDEANQLLASIQREIERISELVDEYLQFSRMPKSLMKRGKICEFIKQVIGELHPLAQSTGIEIDCENIKSLPEIDFDPQQLRRLVLNLTRNAIDAMAGGGRLSVEMHNGGPWVEVAFRDTGSGIASEQVEKIFDPFFTTKSFGTGLGLSIVQQIVKEHNGNIFCESQPGKGTTFFVQLPVGL